MKTIRLFILSAIFVSFSMACTTNVEKEDEIINPVVNLSVTNQGTYYEVKFNAYNVENNFDGYGIFAAATQATAEAFTDSNNASSAAGLFCTATATLESQYVVQIGDSAQQAGTDCAQLNSTTINGTDISAGGNPYITVRAHVDRSESAWSLATSTTVP